MDKALIKILAVMVTLLFPLSAGAEDSNDRQKFLDARQALKAGHIKQFQQLKSELTDYVLYPYVEFAYLEKHLSKQTPEHIQQFLTRYNDTPVASQLRYRWLLRLAKKQQWREYIDFYTHSSDERLQCYYWNAQYQLGNQTKALNQAKKLWMVGKSRPQSCDPLFEQLDQRSLLTEADYWQRIEFAMDNGKLSLANYLAKSVDQAKQDTLVFWQRVYRKPAHYLKSTRFNEDNTTTRSIAKQGILRLARHKPELAWEHYQRLSRLLAFSEQQHVDMASYIGRRGAQINHAMALQWLQTIPASRRSEDDMEWLIRAAVSTQNWQAIVDESAKMLPSDSKRLHYWRARALDALGQTQSAQKIYEWLANTRNYYGFLAADKKQLPYQMEHESVIANQVTLDKLSQHEAMRRVYELRQLKMDNEAHREWADLMRTLPESDQQLAAVIAYQWGWHDQAVSTANQSGLYNDLTLRFPIAYQQSVMEYSEKNGLETSLTFSVMRRESSFRSDARSPAGAMGLMQLMPGTGKQVARLEKSTLKNHYELLSADRNIQLGTAYLRHMMKRFQDNPVLATAAYNAGPHRVKTWLPTEGEVDADVWQEAIPYDETRTYTRDILAFSVVYDYLLNQVGERMSSRMPEIRPLANPG